MNRIEDYKEIYNEFTKQTLRILYTDNKDQNLIMSPFSVMMLLAIAATAVEGDARAEIINALSNDLNYEETIDVLCRMQNAFSEEGTLSSANAVCVQHNIEATINADYTEYLQKKFNGELFTSSDITSDVNKWIKKNTRGLIEKIADDSMRNTLACLVNATAFEGKWIQNYTQYDIEEDEFKNADGTISDVAMLKTTEQEYIEDDSVTGFVKPYKDIDFSFMALLPKKPSETAFKNVLEELDFSELHRKKNREDILVSLPEFDLLFEEDLTLCCQTLGINKIFSGQANFSPLSSEQIKIDSIVHKARIIVDRTGTKAAAATMGICIAGCAPETEYKIVELNRPFIYAIIHNKTGLPVFTGIVNEL